MSNNLSSISFYNMLVSDMLAHLCYIDVVIFEISKSSILYILLCQFAILKKNDIYIYIYIYIILDN
jgi:hypothetical protein